MLCLKEYESDIWNFKKKIKKKEKKGGGGKNKIKINTKCTLSKSPTAIEVSIKLRQRKKGILLMCMCGYSYSSGFLAIGLILITQLEKFGTSEWKQRKFLHVFIVWTAENNSRICGHFTVHERFSEV
jgi:hypothetical protein